MYHECLFIGGPLDRELIDVKVDYNKWQVDIQQPTGKKTEYYRRERIAADGKCMDVFVWEEWDCMAAIKSLINHYKF